MQPLSHWHDLLLVTGYELSLARGFCHLPLIAPELRSCTTALFDYAPVSFCLLKQSAARGLR